MNNLFDKTYITINLNKSEKCILRIQDTS